MILFFVAYIFLLPLTFINFFVVRKKGYFKSTAISIDIFANREFRATWNKCFRTENGYKFGQENETISSALGKNQRKRTLTKAGNLVCSALDFLDKNHCEKSIKEMELVLGRKATEDEQRAIDEAIKVLDNAGLELIGTRPKDR